MKPSTLILILLLVLTNGLLINRQLRIHSLQTTINTQQPPHDPGDLKQIAELQEQNKTLLSTREYAVAELSKEQEEYAKLKQTTRILMDDQMKATPILRGFHAAYPNVPMPWDLDRGY